MRDWKSAPGKSATLLLSFYLPTPFLLPTDRHHGAQCGCCSPASSMPSLSKLHQDPSSPHLNLPIVTDSLDGDCALHEVLRVPGPELNDAFGPSHQAGNGALRLNELLLLILAERRMKDMLLEAGERRSLPGISAPPTPRLVVKSYAGISGAEQTHQEDPAALTGWEEGSGGGMGRRTDSKSGWHLSTTTPTALQSRMHASSSFAARTRKHFLSKRKKKEHNIH